jgi:hypothetical protein
MHNDAAEVRYGGTLGFNQEASSPGLWAGRGMLEARDRAESITLRELWAVRLLLQRHFADYVRREETRKVLLHEDNQAVVYILNAMVSSSTRMMQELRRLQAAMKALKVDRGPLAPVGSQSFCRLYLSVGHRGCAGYANVTVLSLRRLRSGRRGVPLQTDWRAPGGAAEVSYDADVGELGGREVPPLESPVRPVASHSRKIEQGRARGEIFAPMWPAQP